MVLASSLLLLDPAVPVPGQKQASDALSTIASQGVLGSLVVLLIVALVVTIKGWLKSKDQRLDDQKEVTKALKEMNEAAAKVIIESNRASDGVKITLESVTQGHRDLAEKVGDLEKQQVQLVAQVIVAKR